MGKTVWCVLMGATLAIGCGDGMGHDEPGSDAAITADAGADAGALDDGPDYSSAASWLCRPGAASDACSKVDLANTEVHADGSFKVVETKPADNPSFDCFYVHPTVGTSIEPRNDVIDPKAPVYAMSNQAARFTSVCRVYAPLYRQMNLATYGVPDYTHSEYFETAYRDVSRAFDEYMAHDNKGRPFVLIGHSQGTHMLVQLLLERFDAKQPALKQLVSAFLIGPVGRMYVPPGKLTGGTFKNLALCQKPGQRGCIVTYDSKAAGTKTTPYGSNPIPKGMVSACVNPAQLVDGNDVLSETFWQTDVGFPFPDGAKTKPWVAYPEAYSAACEADGMLGLDAAKGANLPAAATPAVIQELLDAMQQGPYLHIPEFNITQGDLLRIAVAQAAAK